jgi:preprotein translocase subunit SecY
MIAGVQNIGRIQELRQRILFTFGMLAVYRVGAYIVTPGIDPEVVRNFFAQMQGTIFGLFTLFSGGALEQLSIFSLGIMPYISASIIFQLLTIVIPQLEELKKEGESGRRKITQWTRYATVVIALFQSTLLAIALESGQFGEGAVMYPGWPFRLMMAITLTTGTRSSCGLGEQITERGIGNGISLVIFAGIVVGIRAASSRSGNRCATTSSRCSERSCCSASSRSSWDSSCSASAPSAASRSSTRGAWSDARSCRRHELLPLRLNTAGVIPAIFASSLLLFPLTIGQFTNTPAIEQFIQTYLNPGGWVYEALYVGLIVFFTYFYTAIMINPADVAENIKRSGAYIPGIRPGKKTAEHIDRILSRITLVGALYISAVCVMPTLLATRMGLPFHYGGTALLIVVGVGLDTIAQIEAHLVSRQYEGFAQGTRIRGRLER